MRSKRTCNCWVALQCYNWSDIIVFIHSIRSYGETVPAKTVDTSILNSEQKLFLDGAIDVKEWMEQSNSFRRHVEVHMKTMQQYAMANKSFDQLMDYQLDRTALRACVMESAFFGIGKEE